MSFSFRIPAIVFLALTMGAAVNPAIGQQERDSRVAGAIVYDYIGEQYLKEGVCAFIPPGDSASASEDLALAEEAFKKAVEVDPACVEAHLNLARLYQFQKSYDRALAEYDQAIRFAPNNTDVLVNMALLQIELGHVDEAVRYLEWAKRTTRDKRTIQRLNRFVIRDARRTDRLYLQQAASRPPR